MKRLIVLVCLIFGLFIALSVNGAPKRVPRSMSKKSQIFVESILDPKPQFYGMSYFYPGFYYPYQPIYYGGM
jgi:hypothetical protein